MSEKREHFSSRLGFILAAAGSAVGIGNLVGFPVSATNSLCSKIVKTLKNTYFILRFSAQP